MTNIDLVYKVVHSVAYAEEIRQQQVIHMAFQDTSPVLQYQYQQASQAVQGFVIASNQKSINELSIWPQFIDALNGAYSYSVLFSGRHTKYSAVQLVDIMNHGVIKSGQIVDVARFQVLYGSELMHNKEICNIAQLM